MLQGMEKETKDFPDIGRRLTAFRNYMDMSRAEMAQFLGVTANRYTNWETGRRRIALDEAYILEERFGLSLDFIYLGKVFTLPHKLASALSERL